MSAPRPQMMPPLELLRALPEALARLERTRVPLRADLELWLLSREVDLETACWQLADLPAPPYWAFCWAAGQALAHHLGRHPEKVRGRRVVDLGTGSGVAALAAARAGAGWVVAVDSDAAARRAASANAELNGLEIEVSASIPTDWDVLLAADVLYEPGLRQTLAGARRPGRQLLVADPRRHPTHRCEGRPLETLEARTLPDVDPPQRAVVLWSR